MSSLRFEIKLLLETITAKKADEFRGSVIRSKIFEKITIFITDSSYSFWWSAKISSNLMRYGKFRLLRFWIIPMFIIFNDYNVITYCIEINFFYIYNFFVFYLNLNIFVKKFKMCDEKFSQIFYSFTSIIIILFQHSFFWKYLRRDESLYDRHLFLFLKIFL